MAYCPFRRADLPAAGHRSSKVIPWPAAEVDFKTHRQSLWASRIYPQPAGRIRPAYTLLFEGSGELDRPGGCHSGYGARLLKPYPRRYADASGRTAALALPLAFPPAHPRAAKGNQLERVLCMALFAYAVWMPQTLPENGAVRWSSQMINSLQFQFNRFINHQIEH